jgi:hypothetical protein
MKLIMSIPPIISILLLSILVASATTSEMPGGMNVVANNGGYLSGYSSPESYTVSLGDDSFSRAVNAGENQEFDALFANDDYSLGSVTAKYDVPGVQGDRTTSYATLPFVAPDNPINILYIKSTLPTAIKGNYASSEQAFKARVQAAENTWNTNNGQVRQSNPFFGTLSPAPFGTSAQRNDKKFVQSFARSSGSWLAGSWLSWNSGKLTDWDVIYNTRYSYSTDQSKTQNPNLRYVDLQAVALHEMGHAIGLDDIYNKADKKWDLSEVMNAYVWGSPRYNLGVGDLTGLMEKY